MGVDRTGVLRELIFEFFDLVHTFPLLVEFVAEEDPRVQDLIHLVFFCFTNPFVAGHMFLLNIQTNKERVLHTR